MEQSCSKTMKYGKIIEFLTRLRNNEIEINHKNEDSLAVPKLFLFQNSQN